MKTVQELSDEFDADYTPEVDGDRDKQAWMKEQMIRGMNTYGVNMQADKMNQATLHWTMQLYEFIIRMFTVDETEQQEALVMFRTFAHDSHLVSMYNALVESTEKKLTIVKGKQ